MVFSSFVFIFIFLPATLTTYYVFRSRKWRNFVLFLASLFFYTWGEPIYIALMLCSILINWAIALSIPKSNENKKLFLFFGILLNMLGIILFKYSNFFIDNSNNFFSTNLSTLKIALPIGISFYTFQAISYLVDTYRGTIKPQKNIIYFGSYLSMFPQLIAGPIVRYQTIENQIIDRTESQNDFTKGLNRFVIGLGKKVIIANTMGSIADTILAGEPVIGIIPAWYGFIAYTFQIYFDFSGYSDMAIGLGRMFGFHFLENFNYPYISHSITEFWRRWHISLSSFFRDYLYIPLGGNRVTSGRWIINLLIVWSLTGFWHGASWNFIFWGIYYGILLAGEKIVWGRWLKRTPRPLQHLYTLFFIVIGWTIFRIENVNELLPWMRCLFGFNGLGHPITLSAFNVLHLYPWFLVAAVGSTPLFVNLIKRMDSVTHMKWVKELSVVTLFFWSCLDLVVGGFNPFIYFRF